MTREDKEVGPTQPPTKIYTLQSRPQSNGRRPKSCTKCQAKADEVMEVACILKYKSVPNAEKVGGGRTNTKALWTLHVDGPNAERRPR